MFGTKVSWSPNEVWTVELLADNLLDKRYRIHGSGIDATGRNFAIAIRTIW
jgi:outer membrane receptor protein involved in Fe transport